MNRKPTVSICVPNLNTRPFLPERFETIFNQTLPDWELLVYDSYSDDGAWEYIQRLAQQEPRMKAWQGPRQGTPGSWNPCIQAARGEYVYIATSDDTMSPDCLEKMAGALESHPECGICQCALEIIGADGKRHPTLRWQDFAFGRFAKEWLEQSHIRPAPLDGVLHFALATVYTSITQLLVRRSVFDRIGLFDREFGPAGDFEWGARAGLLENCIYVPEALATWRVHPRQATGDTESAAGRQKLRAMSKIAFERAQRIAAGSLAGLQYERLVRFYDDQILDFQLRECGDWKRRFLRLVAVAARGNPHARRRLWLRLCGRRFGQASQFGELRTVLKTCQIPSPVLLGG